MVQDQWTETCVSQACALTVWIRAGEDVTAFKMQQSTPAGEDLCRVCVCVRTCVFNHGLSGFKAAESLFSWSEAGVNPVVTFTVFHNWFPV